jgi:hypothetical protein
MDDLASIAAANTAGHSETLNDKGATYPDSAHRFTVTLEKVVRGAAGYSGVPIRAYGQGSTQASAEAQALAGLNAQRSHRYATSGLTVDVDSTRTRRECESAVRLSERLVREPAEA